MAPTRRKAETLFRSKRYADVIRLLEPQIFRFREDFRFYQLLGLSCLHTGDYGGAFSYLKRAIDLRESDTLSHLALALVHARRHETNEALRVWFEILDTEPRNRYALKGIELARKASSHTDIPPDELFRTQRLVPGTRKIHPAVFVSAAALLALACAGILFYPVIADIGAPKPLRDSMNMPGIESYSSLVDAGGNPSLILTESEIRKAYRDALAYFQDYRDNLCRRELNRILLSNAAQPLKDQAALLASHIDEPSFLTFKDPFPYAEVRENPPLYEGCHVVWKGKISNVTEKGTEILFDFLVGYQDNRILEGIVPVRIAFPADLDPFFPIELLARVTVGDAGLRLEGISIHRLSP